MIIAGVANGFPFDWVLRQKAAANINLFILNGCPYPHLDERRGRFLSHAALRLSCNHAGYAPLWLEQLGQEWREPKPKHEWPVLASEDERWTVRAAIDAVVAQAYGLDRGQYAHVLSTFSHRSYLRAPELCLAVFDELAALGFEAFTKQHGPYWDIPLVESLPEPVIDLLLPAVAGPASQSPGPLFDFDEDPAPSTPGASAAQAPRTSRPSIEAAEAYTAILRLLDERGIIGSSEAQEATGLDAAAVRPLLRRLVDEGRAKAEGERRGTKYRRSTDD